MVLLLGVYAVLPKRGHATDRKKKRMSRNQNPIFSVDLCLPALTPHATVSKTHFRMQMHKRRFYMRARFTYILLTTSPGLVSKRFPTPINRSDTIDHSEFRFARFPVSLRTSLNA